MEKTKNKAKSSKSSNAEVKKKLKLLKELQGIGKDIWKDDAQKYVDRLRANDRF